MSAIQRHSVSATQRMLSERHPLSAIHFRPSTVLNESHSVLDELNKNKRVVCILILLRDRRPLALADLSAKLMRKP